ncbi:hypothetical protein FRC03_006681 [Tulasnella sp. 419]|nr:hypothetical protein FRC03_006681 [Tulasnella sp. 419]
MSISTSHLLLGLSIVGGIHAGLTTDPVEFAGRQYDYVVVGGGTAGLAVASRLSENPNKVVGVIEAGPHIPNDPLIYTPGLFGAAQSQPAYDWMLSTVPQPNANGRSLLMPRGKVLGGSSALNYMAYDRGSKLEYDAWGLFGGSGWTWNSFYPWLKKAENTMAPTVSTPFGDPNTIDTQYQGTGGPIQKSYNVFYSNITSPYLSTLNNLGVPTNTHPDSGDATGVYNCPMSVDRSTGKRSYSANTYFTLAQNRPNFHVLTGAEATKVLFNGNVATAVKYTSGGSNYQVNANLEVILSAGSLKTPQLLELSGIGKQQLLQNLGIPVVKDLPGVGENLQDHFFIANSFALKPGFTTFDILRNDPAFAAQQQQQYNTDGTGLYAATHSAFAFLNLKQLLGTQKSVDSFSSSSTLANEQVASSDETAFDKLKSWLPDVKIGQLELIMYPGPFSATPPEPNTSYISILAAVMHPWGRGNVHINSTVPTASPVIDPKYLSSTIDTKLLVAVVYGTTNLRVVDASIMPLHLATHIQATTYGIAEKAAAMIAEDN